VRRLAEGLGDDAGDDDGPVVLRLDARAGDLMIDWEDAIEQMLDDGGDLEVIRDWGSKLAGLTLRLAAVLHCVEHGPAGEIDHDTLSAAVEISRYAIPHAEAVLRMMSAAESTEDADAQYILSWLERERRQTFTRRDAHQHGRRRFARAEDIEPALTELARRGYIRPRAGGSPGPGRPSATYEVHPDAYARPDAGARHRGRAGVERGDGTGREQTIV
jgi:hypothetical protein